MSPSPLDYTILSQTPVNKWDNTLQTAVSGVEVRAVWGAKQRPVVVFVEDEQFNPTNVDAAIRDKGATIDAVDALGSSRG